MAAGSDPQDITRSLNLNAEALNKIWQRRPEKAAADEAGKQDQAAFKEKLENERIQAGIESLLQDTSERKAYAFRSFILVCAWVSAVFVLLLLNGFLARPIQFSFGQIEVAMPFGLFHLSDSVLIAVISGTTASIIGIFHAVANYLFPKR